MTKEIFAAICMEIYSNGKVTNDRTLDERDFAVLADVARGKVILGNYWQARKMEMSIEESGLLNSYLEEVVVDVTEEKDIKQAVLAKKPVTLPHGYGVYTVSPCGDRFTELDVIRIDAGASWMTRGDHDELFFEVMSNKIRFYNAPDHLKSVTVMMVPETSDELPSDTVFDILNMIFGIILKIKGFPVDMQDDGNPNVMIVNKKLAEATIQ